MLPPHPTQPPTSNRPQQAPARPPPAQLSCGQDAGSTGEHLAPKGVTLKCQRWWGPGQRAHCPPSGQVIKGIFLPWLARTMPHVPAPEWGADQHPAGPRGKLLVAKDKGQCCGTSVPSRQPCAQLTGRCYLGRYVQGTPGDACGRRNLAHPAPANLPAEPREEGGCWLPVAVRKPGLQSEGRKALGGGASGGLGAFTRSGRKHRNKEAPRISMWLPFGASPCSQQGRPLLSNRFLH